VREVSTVYGPVRSWRVGVSLGVDLLCVNSICSFRCIYCQLGKINIHTLERRLFVSTARVMRDLRASDWHGASIVTLSGSGEPTLALNMGEVIREIKSLTNKPVLVLSNATTLNDADVRLDIGAADRIFCKLDAADEEGFRKISRPVEGLTLGSVVAGIRSLRAEYGGHLAIQTMLTPRLVRHHEEFARIVSEIQPDEVQLNRPSRLVPHDWFLEARGNLPAGSLGGVQLRQVSAEDAARFERALQDATGVKVSSAYRL
jgi:wyosine [tRNA(Phe)-imidazoG37] synthetase (radical SAM superfamily)